MWPELAERWRALRAEVERLRQNDPPGYTRTPAAKLLAAVNTAVLCDIPADPGAERYRQGKTVARQRATEIERLSTLGAETLNVGCAEEAA